MLCCHSQQLTLQWRHNGRDGVSNHQPYDCLLNRLFKAPIKETAKLRVTGLCEGNSAVTGEFPSQRASNAENVFIWLRHHVEKPCVYFVRSHGGCVFVQNIPRFKGLVIISLTRNLSWFNPQPSVLLHRHWGNHTIAPVPPVKQHWTTNWSNEQNRSSNNIKCS